MCHSRRKETTAEEHDRRFHYQDNFLCVIIDEFPLHMIIVEK